MILFAAVVGPGLLLCGKARAGAEEILLVPPLTRVEFTTYAMGLLPLRGHFERFAGELRVDTAHPSDCNVKLDVEVGSLVMADPGRAKMALGPKLLDEAAYPRLLYAGSCGKSGMLTLHGVSRKLDLSVTREGAFVAAEGAVHRQDFGIDGLPGLIGGRITVTFRVRLPEDVARLVHP